MNLIAINPFRLVTAIHPKLAGSEYQQFDGQPLLIGAGRGPNERALMVRWAHYTAALDSGDLIAPAPPHMPSPKVARR